MIIEPSACFHSLDPDIRLNSDSMAVALHIGSEASGEGFRCGSMLVGMRVLGCEGNGVTGARGMALRRQHGCRTPYWF